MWMWHEKQRSNPKFVRKVELIPSPKMTWIRPINHILSDTTSITIVSTQNSEEKKAKPEYKNILNLNLVMHSNCEFIIRIISTAYTSFATSIS